MSKDPEMMTLTTTSAKVRVNVIVIVWLNLKNDKIATIKITNGTATRPTFM